MDAIMKRDTPLATRIGLLSLGTAILLTVSGCAAIRNLKASCHHTTEPALPAPVRTVTMSGIVLRPGTYEVPDVGGMTLQKAIAEAGGFLPSGVAFNPVDKFADTVRFHQQHIAQLGLTLLRDEITYVIPCPMINTTELGNIRLRDRDVVTVMTLKEAGFDYESQNEPLEVNFAKSNPESTVRFLGATQLDGSEVTLEQIRRISISTAEAATVAAKAAKKAVADAAPDAEANTPEKRADEAEKKEKATKASKTITGKVTQGLFASVPGNNDNELGKIIDWNRNPQIARVTRRASSDGRPRIFYVPLAAQFPTEGQVGGGGGAAENVNFIENCHAGFVLRGGDDVAYLQINQDPLVSMSQLAEQRAASVLKQLRQEASVRFVR